MTKFIGIISAKGGVGKTTTTINLTSALHFFNRRVIALDGNFANPDLGIHLGITELKNNLHSALKEKHHIKESVYKHPSGIWVVPGSISYHEARTANRDNMINTIYGLVGAAEAVIIDSTPGMSKDSQAIIKASDHLIIVTTPDLVSVSGSLKTIHLARELGKDILGIIINKKRFTGYEMDDTNISSFLQKPIIGIIPDDDKIRHSLKTNNPLVLTHPNCETSISYKKIAGILIGQQYETNLQKEEEKSTFYEALSAFGLKKFL